MRSCIRLASALIVCSMAVSAFAGWTADSVSSGGDTVDVSCGAISGTGGLLVDRGNTLANGVIYSQPGQFGATWSGSQYATSSATSANPTAKITHVYRYLSGGNMVIYLDISTAFATSGAACQENMSDPEWWWQPIETVYDSLPTVKSYNESGEYQSTYGWQSPSYTPVNARSSTAGDPNHPATPYATYHPSVIPNTQNGDGSSYQGHTAQNILGQTGWHVKVIYTANATLGADCDNALVDGWKVVLKTTMTTHS